MKDAVNHSEIVKYQFDSNDEKTCKEVWAKAVLNAYKMAQKKHMQLLENVVKP